MLSFAKYLDTFGLNWHVNGNEIGEALAFKELNDTPFGNLDPLFVGQTVFNTVTRTFFIANGPTSADWLEATPSTKTFTSDRYGMIGNGSFDNTSRLQDALYECGSLAATLQMGLGRFCHSPVDCGAAGERHSLTIQGAGWNSDVQADASTDTRGTIFVLLDGATKAQFTCVADQGPMHFRNLLIFGNQAGQTNDAAVGIHFVDAGTAQRSGTMDDLYIVRCRGGAVRVGINRNAGQINRMVALNCGYQPGGAPVVGGKDVLLFGACSDWRVYWSDIGIASRNGIYSTAAGTLELVSTNSFSNGSNGVRVDATSGDFRMYGGSLDRNTENGAFLFGRDAQVRGYKSVIYGTVFSGNSFDANDTYSDIRIYQAKGDIVIRSPQFWKTGATANLVKYNIFVDDDVAGGDFSTDVIVGDVIQNGEANYATAFTNDRSRLILTVLPEGYLSGFIPRNDTGDATNDIVVGPGLAKDDANVNQLQRSYDCVKQIDVTFAEYTDPAVASGGRDANDTLVSAGFFNIFEISGFGKLCQPFLSRSASPTLPTGFTRKVLIGSIYWNGSTIKPFKQVENKVTWPAPSPDLNGTSWTSTTASQTLLVPSGRVVEADIFMSFTPATAGAQYARVEDLNITDATVTSTRADVSTITGENAGNGSKKVLTNTSAQVRRRSSDAGAATGYIVTTGYTDVTLARAA